MIKKRPTLQFLPGNKRANGETSGDGIRGLHRLRLRQIGDSHPRGGLLKMGRTSAIFQNVQQCRSQDHETRVSLRRKTP